MAVSFSVPIIAPFPSLQRVVSGEITVSMLLATTIPETCNFFIQYTLNTIYMLGMELSRLPNHIVCYLCKCLIVGKDAARAERMWDQVCVSLSHYYQSDGHFKALKCHHLKASRAWAGAVSLAQPHCLLPLQVPDQCHAGAELSPHHQPHVSCLCKCLIVGKESLLRTWQGQNACGITYADGCHAQSYDMLRLELSCVCNHIPLVSASA